MRLYAIHIKITKSIVWIFIFAMLFSCKNDIKTVTVLSGTDSIPNLKAINIEFWESDTGVIKSQFSAPIMERYNQSKPYSLFPIGLKIVFYDADKKISSQLTADYARNWEKEKKIEFKSNVIFENFEKGEKLETESLTWDRFKKEIYSDEKIKITTPNDILFGTGLTSDENFNQYVILNPVLEMEVEDKKVKK